jgi:homoserine dehydrogenase
LNDLRLWVVGLGTVGRWLIRALDAQAVTLSSRYGFTPRVVGVANARDGFVYDPRGVDLPTLQRLSSAGRPLTELPGIRHWSNALAGLEATEADVLVEVTASPRDGGEPGVAHMREALGRQISVVTSNKWPVALHGVELTGMARTAGAAFRAESTVMSGTPVLSMLVDGLAGASPVRVRGILNATANFILAAMEAGKSYDDALAEAQEAGLAERDPSADVDGYDSMAKTMILAGLVFGRQIRAEDVLRRGIAQIDTEEVAHAISTNTRIRLVSEVALSEGGLTACVEPMRLSVEDPLAGIEGATNAVVCEAEPVGEIAIVGPGAGPELAGQGVFSDVIAVASRRATTPI